MTEREKSYAEMLYQPADPELAADRDVTVQKLYEYNRLHPLDRQARAAAIRGLFGSVGESCVVKAATEGSALGVYIVNGADEVADAVRKVFEIDSEALAETFVSGTELTCAVIGNDDVQALPVIQIVPRGEFYDFESKYAPGGSQHLCPAPLDAETTARVQETAIAAHRALECRGVSRTDIILDENGECWVLETNTLPGMTETSLLPDAGRAAGIEFPELCTKLIELALEGTEA